MTVMLLSISSLATAGMLGGVAPNPYDSGAVSPAKVQDYNESAAVHENHKRLEEADRKQREYERERERERNNSQPQSTGVPSIRNGQLVY